jgi:hypothetical protein
MTGNYFLSSFFTSLAVKQKNLLPHKKVIDLIQFNLDTNEKKEFELLRSYYDFYNLKALKNEQGLNFYGNYNIDQLERLVTEKGRGCAWLESIYDNDNEDLIQTDITKLIVQWIYSLDSYSNVQRVLKLIFQADLIIAHAINNVYKEYSIDVSNTSDLSEEIERMFNSQKSLFFDTQEVAEEIKRHKDEPVHLTQHISRWLVDTLEKKRNLCQNTTESTFLFYVQYVICDKQRHSFNSYSELGIENL